MGVEKPLLVLFRCMPTTFYETVDPRRLGKLSSVTILDEGNFTPSHYGYFFEEPLLYYREEGPPLGVVFSEPGARIKLALERLSGEFHAWTRTNRQFLTLLRKQFLIWRTLSDEVREGYARQGQD